MSNLGHADGFRKVSRKSRNGRKKNPIGHKGHRTKQPSPYESGRAADRRRRLIDLRAADLDDEDSDLDYYYEEED